MAADGTDLRPLTTAPSSDTDASWSPDGRWIVYSTDHGGLAVPNIFVISVEGGNPLRITYDDTHEDGAPSWSPDGRWIAFESHEGSAEDTPAALWRIAAPSLVGPPSWEEVNDFVYQLQDVNLTEMGDSKFDLVIMDYSRDGSAAGRFTASQIQALKNSPGGAKRVLAYLSIGEAENYRWYWENGWDANNDGTPDPGAPAWLGPANPDWPGSYKVKYWQTGWQSILYGSSTSYLDQIMAAGFDGVYLDIIDAYEYWGPGGESGLNRSTAEQEMVELVKSIANYARITKGRPYFRIFPQNGEALAAHADYVQVVTGIGKEDTWYDGNTPQPSVYTDEVIANLDLFKQAGKLVLVIDYVTRQDLIDDFYARARARGYVPYATVRDLDRLTIHSGHEPD